MKRKILLGEDDPSVRVMLARVLKAAGYDVLLTSGPEDALAELEKASPDLLLLDLKAPQPECWQVFEMISRLHSSVPLVATTAWSNQQEQAARRGIDALMEKPLDLPVLLELISQLTAESEDERTERRQKGSSLQAIHAAA